MFFQVWLLSIPVLIFFNFYSDEDQENTLSILIGEPNNELISFGFLKLFDCIINIQIDWTGH